MKPTLPFLETMITQVCNISCHGCTNYSDLQHRGYVTWEDGKDQLEQWLKVIDIPDFGIMGGEPLINPEVRAWLLGVRGLMPNSQIRFTTNGLLLHKHLDILDLIHDIKNIVFKITVHKEDETLRGIIDDILTSNHKWKQVHEYGITRWKTDNDVRFQLSEPKTFVKSFKNSYNNMKPHNSNPAKAFDLCIQQTCPLLYKGKIYKCSTAGLLKDTLNRFGIDKTDWNLYIDKGIAPTDDIESFINNFGKPNKICGQCPENNDAIIDHLSTVKVRKTK